MNSSILEQKSNKHENYELLNLLGYGLAKFDHSFIKEFGFKNKNSFFNYFVDLGIVKTSSVVKNRMDLFDPFFPNNHRKGWWQKGDAYLHRKILIDNLFGNENVLGYTNIVKLFLKENYHIKDIFVNVSPIIKSRFKKLQETGLEAELYFINNYNSIELLNNGIIEDARLFGDGYDFQINKYQISYLVEVKGIRANKGKFRMTENEYIKALEYKNEYLIALVMNLNDLPKFIIIENPANSLKFKKEERVSKPIIEYHLINEIC